MVRAAWGIATIAGVLPTNTIAGIFPVAVWVVLRAVLGLYPGYGLNAVDELRRQSYATLGALIIASTFLGLLKVRMCPVPCSSVGFWYS